MYTKPSGAIYGLINIGAPWWLASRYRPPGLELINPCRRGLIRIHYRTHRPSIALEEWVVDGRAAPRHVPGQLPKDALVKDR